MPNPTLDGLRISVQKVQRAEFST